MNITLKNCKVFHSVSKSGVPYWSISEHAYQKPEDKLTFFVRFSNKCVEPMPHKETSKSGTSYECVTLAEAECSLSCYQGKPQITVFSYQEEVSVFDKDTNEIDTSMFGGEKSNLGSYADIKQEDLPFY